MSDDATPKKIVYRLAVWASMPLTDDPHHPDFYTEEGAVDKVYQRRLERTIYALLRKCECECDVELLDYEIVEDA